MRLLLVNPNTTAALTDRLAAMARAALPGVEVVAATGAFGARYISDRTSFAIGAHAALDAYARHGEGANAVLLACFGDPGLEALREVAGAPVIGLVEAAAAEASRGGRRFSIVTGGERWGPMLREAPSLRGTERLVSIRTVAPTGGQIASDPDGALTILAEACVACVVEDGAQAVILGGAGLAGLAERLGPHVRADVICSFGAGLRAAEAGLRAPRLDRAGPGPVPAETVGLSGALATLLAAR